MREKRSARRVGGRRYILGECGRCCAVLCWVWLLVRLVSSRLVFSAGYDVVTRTFSSNVGGLGVQVLSTVTARQRAGVNISSANGNQRQCERDRPAQLLRNKRRHVLSGFCQKTSVGSFTFRHLEAAFRIGVVLRQY